MVNRKDTISGKTMSVIKTKYDDEKRFSKDNVSLA